jgi:hypothetical protein
MRTVYSPTQQIACAIYGALHVEKLKTRREITRKLELENAVTKASVLRRSEVAKGLAQVADAMVSRIMVSDLSRSAKEDLLKDLASIPLMLKDVAHAQSRLSVRGNGQTLEEDQREG